MLDPIRDSLEGLSEDVAREYTQQQDTGKFLLQVTPKDGFALEDVKGLKSTLADRKAREERKSKELDGFRDADGNLYDIKSLLLAQSSLEELKDATPKDKVEGIVTQRVAEHKRKFEADVAALTKEKDGLVADLETVVVEQAARAAIAKAGAGEHTDLLLGSVMSHLRSDRGEDGKLRPVVIGENDAPRISLKTGSQALLSVDELVDEMKAQPQFAVCFPGSGNSGGGATGTPTRRSSPGGAIVLSEKEALDHGRYKAAKAQAKEAGVELQIADPE